MKKLNKKFAKMEIIAVEVAEQANLQKADQSMSKIKIK